MSSPTVTRPEGPIRTMPPHVERDVLRLLCQYLLYEKQGETELQRSFQALVAERHYEFHNKDVRWDECKNEVCCAAVRVIRGQRQATVSLSPLSAQLIQGYALHFSWAGGVIYAALEKKPEGVPTFQGTRPTGSLIVTP